MSGNLEDKVAIVTGAARGLGKEYAERLAEEGVAIVVGDVRDCSETVAAVEGAGGRAVSATGEDVARARRLAPARLKVGTLGGRQVGQRGARRRVPRAKGLVEDGMIIEHRIESEHLRSIPSADVAVEGHKMPWESNLLACTFEHVMNRCHARRVPVANLRVERVSMMEHIFHPHIQ